MSIIDKAKEDIDGLERKIQLHVENILFKGQVKLGLNQLLINGMDKPALKQFCQEVIGD